MATEDKADECMPCRGTGKLISNLGGTPQTVTCPWCGGGGVRLTGVDTQASWLGADAEEAAGDEGENEPPDAAA